MDLQTRFVLLTAVGIASFSAGLSLTTACSQTRALPEQAAIRELLPAEPKPGEPARPPVAQENPAPAEARGSAKPAAPNVLTPGMVSVRRLIATHAVNEREPAEPAALALRAPVFAFLELSNRDGVERSVVVTFERAGHEAVGHVRLRIPAGTPRYRTWARTRNLNLSGTWEAVVRADDGTELGRQPFELGDDERTRVAER